MRIRELKLSGHSFTSLSRVAPAAAPSLSD